MKLKKILGEAFFRCYEALTLSKPHRVATVYRVEHDQTKMKSAKDGTETVVIPEKIPVMKIKGTSKNTILAVSKCFQKTDF